MAFKTSVYFYDGVKTIFDDLGGIFKLKVSLFKINTPHFLKTKIKIFYDKLDF